MEPLDRGIAALRRRATWANLGIYAFLATSVAYIPSGIFLVTQGASFQSPIGRIFFFSLATISVIFLICVVLISMWIHRAHANLFEAGFDWLEYTPGWSVGWFFIPFASLIKPYHAMQELWQRSVGDEVGSPLKAWWGCFLGGGLIENVGSRMLDNPRSLSLGIGVLIVGSALRAGSAWFLLRIIRQVTAAQFEMHDIGGTFD